MNHSLRRLVLLMLPLLLIGFGFALGTLLLPGRAAPLLQTAAALPTPDLDALELAPHERTIARVYEQVSPSVVSIKLSYTSGFGQSAGSGSGFVISDEGHIVTNAHVIDGASRGYIEVNFLDGTIVRGTVVGADRDSDLAVLQVSLPRERLRSLTLADSDELVIGQSALAVGSPFGQDWTLTSGIVSALDRTMQGLTSFTIGSVIQTDTAINPGNSGGPLFNLKGEVIGVNSQIASRSRSYSGVGFAIPSNLVQRVYDDLIHGGEVRYSYLGIGNDWRYSSRQRPVPLALDLNLIETLNLPNNLRGVVVGQVAPDSPAERAGLRNPEGTARVRGAMVPTSADIITAINGVPVHDMSSLISWMASHTRPGDRVTLTVLRDGAPVSLPLTLGERPA